ncbi:MAG TPA: hypothetical protein VL860_02415, partial [Planctomycetota bacterium]|nr:hypothetical protein [Planctomycetota bacterium]
RVARGQLFRLRGDVPGRVQYLTQALADTQKAIDALPAGSPDRRFLQEDLERLRIQRAWSALAAGDAKLAQTLAQALAKSGVAPDVAQQATALDAALRKGETPVEPKLTAPVGPTTPPAVPPAPPTPPAVVPTHDR